MDQSEQNNKRAVQKTKHNDKTNLEASKKSTA